MTIATYKKIEEQTAAMKGKTLFCTLDQKWHRIENAQIHDGKINITTDLRPFSIEVENHARFFGAFSKEKPKGEVEQKAEPAPKTDGKIVVTKGRNGGFRYVPTETEEQKASALLEPATIPSKTNQIESSSQEEDELPTVEELWQDTTAELEEIAESKVLDDVPERPDTVQEILLKVARRLAHDSSYLEVAQTVLDTFRLMVEYTKFQNEQKAA